MISEKELSYKYATELKLLTFREELDSLLTLVTQENWSHLELLRKESERRAENRKRT